MFQIAPINPLRFLDPSGNRFDRESALEQINIYQEKKCYLQKWELGDTTRIQVLTSFDTFTFDFYDINTGENVFNIVPIEQNTIIIGQDFKVFEVPVTFSMLGEGEYYAEITYENELEQTISILSEPIEVRESHIDTILFAYRNSDNSFSTVFDTDIEFKFRVEGLIAEFNPASDDLIYNDQKRNATLLDSIPYRTFTLYVAGPEGVPSWVIDRVNRIMACDIVAIDSDYYQKTEGSSWDVVRADEYAFMGVQIEIMPVENRFLEVFKTGKDPGSVLIVNKQLDYENQSGDLAISGEFDGRSLLDMIVIYKSGAPFTFQVGITPGGDEIGEFEVVEDIFVQTIRYAFAGEVTLYITGLVSVDAMYLHYKQQDEDPIPTGLGNNPGTATNLGIGATILFTFTDQNVLDAAFDMVSGLGREETDWEGWAVNDGRNGTVDMGGFLPIGYKSGEEEINSEVGSNSITIGNNNLPEHQHFTVKEGSAVGADLSSGNTLSSRRANGGNAEYNFGGILAEADLSLTSKSGNPEPEPLNITPKSKVVLWVTKVA